MRRIAARLLFLPTLAWNLLLNRVHRNWPWYSRVEDHVLIGALPFHATVAQLKDEGVAAVVNMCEEYAGPTGEYERLGIEQLRVLTVDFNHPSLQDVRRAVIFMQDHISAGRSVYVHCKAGRGRSATVVLCWLMDVKGMTPEEAQLFLSQKRPQVMRKLCNREVVREFYRGIIANKE